MKRDRQVLIRMTDAELEALEQLQSIYSIEGTRATKSFLMRYAIKRLPHAPVNLCAI